MCGTRRAAWVAASCCESKITIANAAGRSTKPESSTISIGWGLRRTCIRPTASATADVRAARAIATSPTGTPRECLPIGNCSTHAIVRGELSQPAAAAERRYPGTCRHRNLPLVDNCGWRVRVDDAAEEFDDLLLGHQMQRPSEQCGDILIRDRLGNWTYQFAAAVDDTEQAVDLVIRGVDLLESTGRQIYLARLLGRNIPPAYMHHPLVMKSPDQKLSKSDGDTGIRDLRAAGWTREEVLAEGCRGDAD